ncbi:MAG: hypothetical protein IKE66_07735 [Hyphomicrobium sp.]|nr:hypothetical protein [Hyphomicrobium sp.]
MILRIQRLRRLTWLALVALAFQLALSVVHHQHGHIISIDAEAAHTTCAPDDAKADCKHSHHDHDSDHDCIICWAIAATAAFILPVLLVLFAVSTRDDIRPHRRDAAVETGQSQNPFGPRGPPLDATA